jgi:hypothetical protein
VNESKYAGLNCDAIMSLTIIFISSHCLPHRIWGACYRTIPTFLIPPPLLIHISIYCLVPVWFCVLCVPALVVSPTMLPAATTHQYQFLHYPHSHADSPLVVSPTPCVIPVTASPRPLPAPATTLPVVSVMPVTPLPMVLVAAPATLPIMVVKKDHGK